MTFTVYDEGGNPRQVPARVVVCTTGGCANAGAAVSIPDVPGSVQCGPCGQWIIPPSDPI